MSANSHDIFIQIHLNDNAGIRSKELLQALDTLETALYASDRQDIERVSEKLGISSIIRDACLERLRKYRNDRLLLTGANNGSIELFGMVAGVSYFLLQKTIGESFKEGFKETALHENLKDFFRRVIDDKALFISESLRRVFANKKKQANIKMAPSDKENPNRIIIDIHGEPTKGKARIRSLGEELDETNNKW